MEDSGQSVIATQTAAMCRICWKSSSSSSSTDGSKTDLVNPCYCKGSVGKVHIACLEQWLEESATDHCDLCFYKYRLETSYKYGTLQSVGPFFRQSDNKARCKQLTSSIPILSLLILLACCSCIFAIYALDNMQMNMMPFAYQLFRFIFTICMVILLFAYVVTLFVVLQDILFLWQTWRHQQLSVHVILPSQDFTNDAILEPSAKFENNGIDDYSSNPIIISCSSYNNNTGCEPSTGI